MLSLTEGEPALSTIYIAYGTRCSICWRGIAMNAIRKRRGLANSKTNWRSLVCNNWLNQRLAPKNKEGKRQSNYMRGTPRFGKRNSTSRMTIQAIALVAPNLGVPRI
ncbi:MAG: hypothetical protein HY231_16595 [Acidobacteria bacterium]|nr:hypothetical protein [Acidobacteriota bacterium]